MIRIRPEIDFKAACPRDSTPLRMEKTVIAGMRSMAAGACPSCKGRYLADLPASHALWSPAVLDLSTHEVTPSGPGDWYAQLLRRSFLCQETAMPEPKVRVFSKSDKIILVNCLDHLYGHALLKLLNVQRHLEEDGQAGGVCALVPSELVHLVPEGVSEIWEFPVRIKDNWKWYPALDAWIQKKMAAYAEVSLSPAYSHPGNRFYDLGRFVRDLPDVSGVLGNHAPVIFFSYREDRLWGGSLSGQNRRLQSLYDRLSRIFPRMAFILAGFGMRNAVKPGRAKLIDSRADRFEVQKDKEWMALMKASDCAIGVHGSNMLLPSGLSKSTVELLPRARLGNMVQDFLFPRGLNDPREALLRYRLVNGDDWLTDVSPGRVTDIVAELLADNERDIYWLKKGEPESAGQFVSSQPEVRRLALQWLEAQEKFLNRGFRKAAGLAHGVLDCLFP